MGQRAKILDLANHLNRTKTGEKGGILYGDPEYRILEPVVTDDMADVGMFLGFRLKRNAKEISELCGKPLEETTKLLWDLSMAGVCFVNEIDGDDCYWTDLWVPGIMEMMANNLDNVKKHPQIAEAFNDYGIVRGAKTAGNFPVGLGLMRVIPIEHAIDGETRRASYEEVSGYLNENTVFSVSDCACRTVRESMGEGCGHLKEDMCIQMGHAAEYYIRTKRGRAITREEAFEIIRRAEENGLMHQIPNTDGPGKTHAICNCCGCSCLSLRTAEMFLNNDMVRSNYVSKVDPGACVACGECVQACPVNAVKLGQKICAKTPVAEKKYDIPNDTKWGPEYWKPDYRTAREDVALSGTSPCKTECPAHIAIQGYIKLASQGRYTEALELIKRENPFPAVCGRICPRKCESACTRGDIDDPIAIDEIKKFIAERDLHETTRFVPKKRHDYGNKIAVIGAGPAGLSCAFYLAIDGYAVTVFERQKMAGGMLMLGIPSFRLEKDVVNAEIEILRAMGVAFRTGVEVGRDVTLADLRSEGYEAFYLAVGAQSGRKLGIEGEGVSGVVSGVDFLREVNLGSTALLDGNVVVIGGGNVAIDVARTAVRTGAGKVGMFCLESEKEMPALPEEIHEANSENISIGNGWGPKRILSENGRVTGVEFKRCISVFDANHRFAPKYDETDTITVPADHVLVSVGQSIEWGGLLNDSKIELNPNRTVCADSFTYQTGEPDVFAGGDAYTGPRFAVDAIAAGKEAAVSIHRYVQPGQSLVIGRDRRDYRAFDKKNLIIEGYDETPRQQAAEVIGVSAGASFRDLRVPFTEEQIRLETSRCLSCGACVVDTYMCVGCGQCTTKCRFDAITLVKVYDKTSVPLKELKPAVAKNMIRRQGRIAVKNVKRLFLKQ